MTQPATDADLLDLLAEIALRLSLGYVRDKEHALRMLQADPRARQALLARVDDAKVRATFEVEREWREAGGHNTGYLVPSGVMRLPPSVMEKMEAPCLVMFAPIDERRYVFVQNRDDDADSGLSEEELEAFRGGAPVLAQQLQTTCKTARYNCEQVHVASCSQVKAAMVEASRCLDLLRGLAERRDVPYLAVALRHIQQARMAMQDLGVEVELRGRTEAAWDHNADCQRHLRDAERILRVRE